MAGHYETLGVSPRATHDQIRQAYLEAARRWHPDRFGDSPASESAKAEASMRRANEAWRVLGDTDRRKRYDLERSGASTAGRSAHIHTEDGITRVDPRLLDPRVIAARREAQMEKIDAGHSTMLRVLPVLAFFGLLVGIFVFTAYANGSSATAPSDTTAPGPSIGVPAGACVRIQSGPTLIEVPCTGTIDGRVVGAAEPGAACPALTVREVELSNGVTACLGTA